ncbi:MAG: hypothetical protein HMLIMOIP_000870 [Candidatus Nitrosomirales archaeon]|jgi:hypothetical protein
MQKKEWLPIVIAVSAVVSAIGSMSIVPWVLEKFVDVPDIIIGAVVVGNSTHRNTVFLVGNAGIATAEDVLITYFANGQIIEPVIPMSPEKLSTKISTARNVFTASLPRLASESRVGFGIWIENGTRGYSDQIMVTHKGKMTELTVDPEEEYIVQATRLKQPYPNFITQGLIASVVASAVLLTWHVVEKKYRTKSPLKA